MRGKRKAAPRPETEEIRFEPPKPGLEFMARFEVNLDAPVLELGRIESLGRRRIIPITGGKFIGPRLNGKILNNGADWQMVSANGLAYLDTRYALETNDGALIYIQTRGFRYGPADVMAEVAKGNPVDPNKYYFRVYIQFETGSAVKRCQHGEPRLPQMVFDKVYNVLFILDDQNGFHASPVQAVV